MGDNKGASDVDGQVWDAFDPDRTMREAMAVASTSEEASEWLTAIAADAAPAWEALRAATKGAQKLHRDAVDAFTVLVDQGWAVRPGPLSWTVRPDTSVVPGKGGMMPRPGDVAS